MEGVGSLTLSGAFSLDTNGLELCDINIFSERIKSSKK